MEAEPRDIVLYVTTDDLLLLCGGDKSSQTQNIVRAKQYWTDFQERNDANP